MARVLTQSRELESSSGKNATPSAEFESGSKSVQRQRLLTNVSSLVEIHMVAMSVVPALHQVHDRLIRGMYTGASTIRMVLSRSIRHA